MNRAVCFRQYDSLTAVDGLDVRLDGLGYLAAEYDERLQ